METASELYGVLGRHSASAPASRSGKLAYLAEPNLKLGGIDLRQINFKSRTWH